jgi:phosphatidylglycerol---prolipoprotein diacylglyceryl transferase
MHPVLVTIGKFQILGHAFGPLFIYSYGAMLAVAFVLGLLLFVSEGKKVGLRTEDMLDLTIYVIIFSIIGARLLYIILMFKDYASNPLDALKIYQGGLSYHGGAIGGFSAVAFFAWRRKLRGWRITDAGIPGLVLGAAIARIGCFLNGCCYGHESHLPWALKFPALNDGITRHPAQIYDLILNLTLLGLLFFFKRFKRKEGDIFAFYLIGFSILRFITEIFRSGATGKLILGGTMTQAQAASFPIMVVGILLFLLPAGKLLGSLQVDKNGIALEPKKQEKPAHETGRAKKKSKKKK